MAIQLLSEQRWGPSWLVHLNASDEEYFTGEVRHAHLGDPGTIDEDLQLIIGALSSLPYVGIAFQVISISWAVAKNGDGTYDMYYLAGWRKKPGWIPAFIWFWGFVSDRRLYPPVKLNTLSPGPMLPISFGNLIQIPNIRAVGNHFRNNPAPPEEEIVVSGRRYRGNMYGERYLANINSKEIHDLDNEDVASTGCQIEEIIDAQHERPYNLIEYAHEDGYDNCAKCLPGSTR